MSSRKVLSIKWTTSAWEGLDGITEYLLAEGVAFDIVEGYVKRIFNAPGHLATLPGVGKPGRVANTREWLVKNTPYALIYMVDEGNVYVLRVMRSSRRFLER